MLFCIQTTTPFFIIFIIVYSLQLCCQILEGVSLDFGSEINI